MARTRTGGLAAHRLDHLAVDEERVPSRRRSSAMGVFGVSGLRSAIHRQNHGGIDGAQTKQKKYINKKLKNLCF